MSTVVVMLSTYNGELFLREQLESISRQKTSARVILYVRDDGSTDGTKNILNEYQNKIDIEYLSDNKGRLGPAKSFWNLLMTSKKADFYCFADQDDIWDINKIEHSIQCIKKYQEKYGQPVLYCCGNRVIDVKGNVIEEQKPDRDLSLDIISQAISGEVPGCAMFFEQSMRDQLVEKNLQNIPMHDLVVMIYAIVLGKVVYEKIPLFSRRIHGNNVIAKAGKSKYRRYLDAALRWVRNKGLITGMAEELLDDEIERLNKGEREYLKRLCLSRKQISSKYYILTSPKTYCSNKAAVKSFKLRVLLNLL